jgi:predicted AAA+ superfamily ATPase
VLADRRPLRARFLILGSASPELLRQSSETLAGRIEVVPIGGFSLEEAGSDALARHWRRGGFPQSFLARTEANSFEWRRQFVQTFLERDLPQLGVRIAPQALLRFWSMLAHYHGNVWNAAELARSLSVSQPTIRQYLDLMTGLFMVRQLQPWHENLGKRQVKAPKVYVRDSGLLHQLLGVATERDLQRHPKLGASFEGYAIEEVLRAVKPAHAHFWGTHSGAELDLLLSKGGKRFGVEVKHVDAPRLTPSMRSALDDLGLERLTVIYPGQRAYALSDRVHVLPIGAVAAGAAEITAPPRPRRARRGP